mmetsp:Transcript_49485/g.115742  ORF Transcript_49485/g.115742 Transcript_49485/m.115742 type:complete len:225 (+) Transcript_49485:78-752(+)
MRSTMSPFSRQPSKETPSLLASWRSWDTLWEDRLEPATLLGSLAPVGCVPPCAIPSFSSDRMRSLPDCVRLSTISAFDVSSSGQCIPSCFIKSLTSGIFIASIPALVIGNGLGALVEADAGVRESGEVGPSASSGMISTCADCTMRSTSSLFSKHPVTSTPRKAARRRNSCADLLVKSLCRILSLRPLHLFFRSRSYSASSVGNSNRQTGHSLLFFSQSTMPQS